MTVELSGHYGYRRIIKTMIPMIVMMIVISVYSMVDGFFISNYAGSDAFAGMNLIWPAIQILGAIGIMVGTGGSALVSKTLGEGEKEKAQQIFSMLMSLTFIIGVVLGIILFIALPYLATALGANEAMKPYCVLYGRIIICVLPIYMLQMAFQPFFMVAEKPHHGTVLSIACGVANIVLDAIFVVGFGWGLAGAAVASATGLLIGGLYPLWFFSSKKNKTHLKIIVGKFDWKSIGRSFTNGLSEFVGNISLSIASICYNWQLMRYIGADGVSAYGILMYIGFITSAVFIGYNMGISQVIAYNYGARNKAEMRSLLVKSLILISIFSLFITIGVELCSNPIAKVFVGYSDSLCDLTTHAIRIYMLSFLLCGFNMFASAWFTSLNNGVVSAIVAGVRTLIFELGSVFILPLILGIDGIWMSVNVAEVFAIILSAALIVGFRKRYGY